MSAAEHADRRRRALDVTTPHFVGTLLDLVSAPA